jgi:phosphohistidine phosphatase
VTPPARTLHLLRHAKSRWDQLVTDHERGLAPRGNKALVQLAAYLTEQQIRPELVLTSTARRALETLDGVREALGAPEVRVLDRLYGAGASDIVDLVRATEPRVPSVLVVGHNPGLHELVIRLARRGPRLRDATEKFPTATLASLTFGGEWRALDARSATLDRFVRPRDL